MKRWVVWIDRGLSRVSLFTRPWWKREWTFDDGCEDSSKNKSAARIIVAVWRIPALWGTDLQ